MRRIYWLASYPKSGNTWMRAFLTNYRLNGEQPAAINELDAWPAYSRNTFDELAGIESTNLTESQISYYRPLVYERLSAASNESVFLKVHDAYTYNDEAQPIFPEQATAGVIYLVRNPLDVAVSYAHHCAESIDDTIDEMANDDAGIALRCSQQLPQRLSSWSGHIASWKDQASLKTLVIRYEDMLNDPFSSFSRVVRFVGFAEDAVLIHKAIAYSSFEQLRSQEMKAGFAERAPAAISFFRQGETGSWRKGLDEDQIRRIVTDHKKVMSTLGYLSPSGEILC